MSAEQCVGVAEHYAQFVKLCRLRIEQLGITYDTVDEICGFGTRYTAKLLCETKAMSVYSLFTIARALALLPTFQHDESQLEKLQGFSEWQTIRRKGMRYRPRLNSGAVRFVNYVDFYKQIGRKGAIRANALRMRRKEAARKAALARWSNNAGQ